MCSFNDTATTEIYTLSLHDALPISCPDRQTGVQREPAGRVAECHRDRKSTRLNSSHLGISYAVFCLKKKLDLQLSDAGKSKLGAAHFENFVWFTDAELQASLRFFF